MNKLECLTAMRTKIVQGWIQGSSAVDANGNPHLGDDPGAVAWCITGAAQCVAPDDFELRREIYNHIKHANQLDCQPSDFNDVPGRTKEEVLAAIDVAIGAL